MNLGDAAYRQGQLDRSAAMSREALAIFRASGVKFDTSMILVTLAYLALAAGDLPQAMTHIRESIAISQTIEHRWLLANAIASAGAALAAHGDACAAAQLLGSADAMRDASGHPRLPHHFQHEQALAQVRAALGETAFQQHWSAGKGLTAAEAIERAQSGTTTIVVSGNGTEHEPHS
jgi:hypothetical protein